MKKYILMFLLLSACAGSDSPEIIYPAPVPKVDKDKIQQEQQNQ